MKFFIALGLYVITVILFLLILTLSLGTPEIYSVDFVNQQGIEYAQSKGLDYTELQKLFLQNQQYYIKPDFNEKIQYVAFLVTMGALLFMGLDVVVFFTKSYIMIPLIIGKITSVALYIVLWYVPYIIDANLLFQLYNLFQSNNSTKIMLLAPFLIMKVFIITLSLWYKV